MGTSPITDSYVPGVDCPVCNLPAFGGIIPRYIEVHLEGMFICPGLPQAPPNGVYLLTQIAPCDWTFNDGFWDFKYKLIVGNSNFTIFTHPWEAFFASVDIECLVSFNNERLICGMENRATGGTASMFWGPTIGS